jgi:hypothetical protein
MRFLVYAIVTALALFASFRVFGANHPPFSEMKGGCSHFRKDLREEFRLWKLDPTKVDADMEPTDQSPMIAPGRKFELELTEGEFPLPAGESGNKYKGKYGGFVRFIPPKSGTFQFSIGHKVWLGILDFQNNSISAQDFEMQTACGQIFKVVSFLLKKGHPYFLEILGSPRNQVSLLVTNPKRAN